MFGGVGGEGVALALRRIGAGGEYSNERMARGQVSGAGQQGTSVVVTNVDISFGQMVNLMVKFAFASIPVKLTRFGGWGVGACEGETPPVKGSSTTSLIHGPSLVDCTNGGVAGSR